ncbi:MAG: PepSY-like domain-containing protein [Bacteroidia bacterium]|nr:PepSY-like domain-containing protein [Bacteroidia bacterium]
MKKLVFTALLLTGFGWSLQAQVGTAAPAQVQEAFNRKFPGAAQVEWGKESATEWEAEFILNGVNHSANFLQDGTWKETEHLISAAEITPALQSSLNSKFPDYSLLRGEIADTPKGSKYELVLQKGNSMMLVVADESGKILMKKARKGKGSDDSSED